MAGKALGMTLVLLGMSAAAFAAPGDNELISASLATGVAAGEMDASTMSGDGRFVAFSGTASTVVPDDTNGAHDVFLRDRLLGTTELISVGLDGQVGNGHSNLGDISADGRFVVFESDASNLVEDGTTDNHVYVRDRVTGRTERAFFGEDIRAFATWQGRISDDGRFVSLQTDQDIFLTDLVERTTRWIGSGYQPRISGNGQYVLYGTPGPAYIVVWDRISGSRRQITDIPAESPFEIEVSISFDGRWVSFRSAYRESEDDTTDDWTDDIFLWDRLNGTKRVVTVNASGVQANGSSYGNSVSDDGRYVAFGSCATNLVPDGRTQASDTDVFIKDMHSGAIERVTGGGSSFTYSGDPSMSGDGLLLAFLTTDSLVTSDRNGTEDVYVHETGRSTTYPTTSAYNLRPRSIQFGDVPVRSFAKKGFTLVNTGNSPLPMTTVEVLGPDRSQYAAKSYCGTTLAVGSRCWIAVTFKPTTAGYKVANLHLVAGGIDRHRALRGTGVR